jgi:hypothetical protein
METKRAKKQKLDDRTIHSLTWASIRVSRREELSFTHTYAYAIGFQYDWGKRIIITNGDYGAPVDMEFDEGEDPVLRGEQGFFFGARNWTVCICCGELFMSPTMQEDYRQHWYCDGLANSMNHSADVIFAPKVQAVIRGALVRNRVLPAMLSPDPADLERAVQFCVNGFK